MVRASWVHNPLITISNHRDFCAIVSICRRIDATTVPSRFSFSFPSPDSLSWNVLLIIRKTFQFAFILRPDFIFSLWFLWAFIYAAWIHQISIPWDYQWFLISFYIKVVFTFSKERESLPYIIITTRLLSILLFFISILLKLKKWQRDVFLLKSPV